VKNQHDKSELKFNRINDEVPIRSTYINENGHNYYIMNSQYEKVMNCLKLADEKSKKAVTKVNILLENNSLSDDLCFKFEKLDNQGAACDRDYTPEIQGKYKIRTSPALPQSYIDGVV
jgi:hypothetical protein